MSTNFQTLNDITYGVKICESGSTNDNVNPHKQRCNALCLTRRFKNFQNFHQPYRIAWLFCPIYLKRVQPTNIPHIKQVWPKCCKILIKKINNNWEFLLIIGKNIWGQLEKKGKWTIQKRQSVIELPKQGLG